jgi:hypothetical protein
MEIGEEDFERIKRLSPTLRRILRLIPSGRDNHEIARAVNLSENTMGTYMVRLYSDLNVPEMPSKKDRRRHLGRLYERFITKYEVDDEGYVLGLHRVEPTPQPISPEPEAAPKTNGHANGSTHPAAQPERPISQAPKIATQGYGVGISISLPEPQSIVEIAPAIILGAEGSAERLQSLIQEGFIPELITDYQSLSGTRSITKLILVKRKS